MLSLFFLAGQEKLGTGGNFSKPPPEQPFRLFWSKCWRFCASSATLFVLALLCISTKAEMSASGEVSTRG